MSNRALASTLAKPATQPAALALQRPGVTESAAHGEAVDTLEAARAAARLGRSGPSPGVTAPARTGPSVPPGLPPNIRDDNVARALVTQVLIRELAPLLGLDPERIQVRVDGQAQVTLRALGADGLMENGTVLLDRIKYQPAAADGRNLLAHELVHVAQRAQTLSDPPASALGDRPAEREARELARRWQEHRTVARPRQRLRRAARAPRRELSPDSSVEVGPTPQAPPKPADLEAVVEANYGAELKEIDSLLSYGVFDWAITDGDVTEVLRIFEPLGFPTALALAGVLTAKQRERLADNLSPGHFRRFRPSILTLYLAVVQKGQTAKLPADPFDGMSWTGLSKQERYALYHVLEAWLPTDQGAKWFAQRDQKQAAHVEDVQRLEPGFDYQKELEKDFKTQSARAEERAAREALVHKPDVSAFLDRARKALSYNIVDWAVTDNETLRLLDASAAFAREPAKLRAIVDTLEGEGLMGRWITNLPVEALYTDVGETAEGTPINRRKAFLQLVALRPPHKTSQLVEELLSYGFFDWAITDEEAYLALQLLKALPPAVREGFYAMDGGKFAKRLDEELSLSMKKGETANPYRGGEDGGDRKALHAQLLDDGLWSQEQLRRLRMLIQMAIAAGDHDWVFGQSKDRYLQSAPFRALYQEEEFFRRIIEGFQLYKPKGLKRPDGTIDGGREFYVGETVEGKPFGTDNAFWKYFIQGLDFIFESGNVELVGESIGGEGLDFGEFQDLTGGSFLGAEFKREEQVPGAVRRELADNSVRWDLDQGVLQMRAARLEIANIHYPMAGLKVQSGTGVVTGLHLHLQYPTEESEHRLTTLQLRVDSLRLDDFLLIFTDSIVGLESVQVDGLTLELRPENVQEAFASPHGGAAVKVPIFWPLLGPVVNLIKLSGSIDELAKGLLEPSSGMDLTLTSQNLTLKGLTTSGGQYVDDISLGPLNLRTRYARRLDFYLRGLQEERTRLQGRLEAVQLAARSTGPKPRHYLELDTAASLNLQLESIDHELARIAEAQAERERLTQLKDQGQLSPADEHKLWRVSKYLDGLAKGGIALDVASARISGLAGNVTAREITLGATHGYGQSGGAALGLLFSSTTMNRLLRGPDYRGTVAGVDQEGDPQFFLETENLTIRDLAVLGSIPRVEETEKALAKAQAALDRSPSDASRLVTRARAQTNYDMAVAYWSLLSQPDALLTGGDRDKLNEARKHLQSEKAFSAELLSLDQATLELGQAGAGGGMRIGIGAEQVHGKVLQAGGVVVGALEGRNVLVDASSKEGLSALMKDWRKQVKGGHLLADSLEASDIRHEASGGHVDRVAATNLGLGLQRGGAETQLAIQATKIEVTGVSLIMTRALLEAEKRLLETVPPAARREADDKKILAIEASLQELANYEQLEADAQAELDAARAGGEPKAIALAQEKLKLAQETKVEWQRRLVVRGLTLDNLNVSILGMGDVFSEDFDFEAMANRGIKFRGKGPNGQWLSQARLTDSKIPGLYGKEVVLGPTGGQVDHDEMVTRLNDFFIDSLTVTGLEWNAPPHHVSSVGTSVLTKLTGSAVFERERRKDAKGIETLELARVTIPSLHVDQIAGQNLNYTFASKESLFDVEIESGSVDDINVTGLQIDFTEDEKVEIHGTSEDQPAVASVGFVNDLKLRSLIGQTMAARGTLNGHGLKAEFINANKRRYTVEELTATEGHFSQRGVAEVGFTLRKISAAVTQEITETGDKWTIEKIRVPSATFKKGSTITKGRAQLEILGSAVLEDTTLSAEVTRVKQGDDLKVASVVITDLLVPRVTANDLHLTLAEVPADPAKGKEASAPVDIALPSAEITGLHVWGFDVLNLQGSFETKTAKATDLVAEIGKKGEDSFKRLGLSIKGTGLAGTLMGPKRMVIDLGNIEEIKGSFQGFGVDVTAFSLQNIGGNVDIGPDYLRVFSLNTGPLTVGPVSYKDKAGTTLDIASVDCTALHLEDFRVEWIKDETTKEEKLSRVTFSGLKFDKITARTAVYSGTFTSKNDAGDEVVTGLTLEAPTATIEPLVVNDFVYDALANLISVEPSFGKASLPQFQAKFNQYVAGRFAKKASLISDITADNFQANMSFGKVLKDGKESWAFSHGTFHLDKFGLKAPNVAYMGYDDKHKLQEWMAEGLGGKAATLDLAGIDFSILEDGSYLLKLDNLIAKDWQLFKKGAMNIRLPLLEIRDIAAATKGDTLDDALDKLALKTGEIHVQGFSLLMVVDRGAPPSKGGSSDPVIVEPLDGAEGEIHGLYDLSLVGPVTFDLPVKAGKIDLYRTSVLGQRGDQWEGNERMEKEQQANGYFLFLNENDALVVNNPFYNYEVEETRGMAGFHHTMGKRGTLVLRELVEGIYNAPASGGPPKPLEFLNDIGLRESEIQLGDGKVGTKNNYLVLSGKDTAKNLFKLLEDQSLGHRVRIGSGDVHAASGHFKAGSKDITTGALDLTNVKLEIKGLGTTLTITVLLKVQDGRVAGVEFGDVKLIETTKKEAAEYRKTYPLPKPAPASATP